MFTNTGDRGLKTIRSKCHERHLGEVGADALDDAVGSLPILQRLEPDGELVDCAVGDKFEKFVAALRFRDSELAVETGAIFAEKGGAALGELVRVVADEKLHAMRGAGDRRESAREKHFR